jgi:hypothetical protein
MMLNIQIINADFVTFRYGVYIINHERCLQSGSVVNGSDSNMSLVLRIDTNDNVFIDKRMQLVRWPVSSESDAVVRFYTLHR